MSYHPHSSISIFCLQKDKLEDISVKMNEVKLLKNDIKKRQLFKTLLSEYLRNSSIIILNRLEKSKSAVCKLFWFIILILGLVGSLSQSAEFLITFFSYPVVINLETMKAKYFEFPAVTVCNINSYRRQFQSCVEQRIAYHECLGINKTGEREVPLSYNITLPECKKQDKGNFAMITDSKFAWIFKVLSLSYTDRIKYGHQFKDFIISCVYNGLNCDAKDFQVSPGHMYGNCYTFNSNPSSTKPGPTNGLQLELNLEVNQYSTLTQSVGAVVQIHKPRNQHTVSEKGIFVRPGYETHITVTKSVTSRLPPPYKDRCRKYELGRDRRYCKDLCEHNLSTSRCSCTVIPRWVSKFPHCDITDLSTFCCLSSFSWKNLCDCPPPCEDYFYTRQLSSHPWPTKTYYKETVNDTSDPSAFHQFRQNHLRIKVYYETLDFNVYKQTASYQNSEIFSQVGGHMGLWLGLSFVFIFECLESGMIFCRELLKYFKNTYL